MKTCTELHDEAMDLAAKADIAARDKKFVTMHALLKNAFRHEKNAARQARDEEPSRSVLWRSAAAWVRAATAGSGN